MILGHRDGHNILQETSVLPPDELWNKSLCPEEDKQRCYTFMNRLLDFIKEQFPQNDRSLVKHFKWDKDIQIVSIYFKSLFINNEIHKMNFRMGLYLDKENILYPVTRLIITIGVKSQKLFFQTGLSMRLSNK